MWQLQQIIFGLLPLLLVVHLQFSNAYNINLPSPNPNTNKNTNTNTNTGRRAFFTKSASLIATSTFLTSITPQESKAIGPVKINLLDPTYTARICPPDRPIPGEKAMKGMKGVCVTVKARLSETSPKDLDKVGIYGFVTDALTGNSVLANNPDLSTDAGQFAMIDEISTKTKNVEFEFIAAVPMETDLSKEENGIGELDFSSLRLISFPGGQQFGTINPCEMNEFSSECEDWEDANGPYVKGKFMIQSNDRTKGR